jgi:hypothetical protein
MKAKEFKTTASAAVVAARERAELYFAAHPRSPSAVRRPKLSRRSGVWVALLGKNIEEGIVGFGISVEAALRAFDAQYLAALRSPIPSSSNRAAA